MLDTYPPTNRIQRSGGRRRRLFVCSVAAVALALSPTVPTAAEGTAAGGEPQAMTQERIDEANDAFNDVPAALEFVTMSDSELMGEATQTRSAREVAYAGAAPYFQRISDFAEAKGFTPAAVANNGDVIGANEPEYEGHQAGEVTNATGWYQAAEQVMSETFPEAEKLFTQGNHDIADLMGEVFDESHAEDSTWHYPQAEDDYVGNFHTTIAGFDFIGLDYNGTETFGYAGAQSGYQDFLQNTLDEIRGSQDYDQTKPIFVFVHSGYADTSLGGPFHGDYDLAGPDVQTILAEFPQAMLGSAHTHFSSNPETSIFQKDFTIYENASMNYIYQDVGEDFLDGEYFDGNQGDPANGAQQKSSNFISVLEDGRTVIRRFDVTGQRWMGMPWVIDTTQGTDGFDYTDDDRSTIAPWWDDAAAITAEDVAEDSLTLGFDHADDDELVNYYEVEISDEAGQPVEFSANQVPDFGDGEATDFSGVFKAFSRYYMAPNTMSFDITGLEPGQNYTVSVRAFDDFENKSEPLEATIATAGGPGEGPEPTEDPTDEPTGGPTEGPTSDPTDEPTGGPTEGPTSDPTDEPGDDSADAAADTGSGDAAANGDTSDDPNGDGGDLPRTGVNLVVALALAIGLIAVGVLLIVRTARRRARD